MSGADPGSPARRQQLLRVRGRNVTWVPPLLLLVAIAVVDWNTSGEFRVISWIVLVPGIAAAICGVRATATFAVLALLAYIEVDASWPHQNQTGLPDFILVAVGGALATLACAVRVREERRMLHMRDVADTTRRTVLRPLPTPWGGLDHAAVYLAADSEARVGGDFYDIQPGPHGTRVLLGDVQGKGLPAVAAAAALLGTFRESAYHEASLAVVAERLEVRMGRHRHYVTDLGEDLDGDPERGLERFATAVLVAFPPPGSPGGHIEVVNFGHEPPLVAGPRGVRALPPGDGLPLGLAGLVGSGSGIPPVRTVPLAADETLLLVTDGVTEARDADGVFFPLRERVTQAVTTDPTTAHPAYLVELVREGTLHHSTDHVADDTTIFAIRQVT
ncbi:PP2C family protein-serine/threonine phosphatase [Streptomyces sp. NBC_00878]|uniref:PP2C family protein-serine/threonine phosphatase n=1 Tax=Streptomyces sp. NBC_00878 TaxID=2975854 RepID=UPI00224F4996|nr:PP2C family protein-serine/threonine phosphatase [Streptomyces sp. NBC_00878]MCX4907286.1 serine/threonine-protein phosphatase [Streptomyces sp. NBC_00878]